MDTLTKNNHAMGLKHFNSSALNEILMLEESGETGLLSTLIVEYQSNTVGLPDKFLSYESTRDFSAIEMLAHSLKSSSQLLGLERLGAICKEVEHAAHDSVSCLEQILTLISELKIAKLELENFMNSRAKVA